MHPISPSTSTEKPYTLADFRRDFPDEKSCLLHLAAQRWPQGIECPKCAQITKHHPVTGRKKLACQRCGQQVAPTANTIFHKSATPLSLWFQVIFLMQSGNVSAKQVQREIGVTYKTAWRMRYLIKKQLDEGISPLCAPLAS